MDCVSEKGSTLLIAKSFASKKGKIVTILPVKDETLDKEFSGVEHDFTLVYTLLGDSFDFGPIPFAANPDDKRALEDWWVPMPRSFSLDLRAGADTAAYPSLAGRARCLASSSRASSSLTPSGGRREVSPRSTRDSSCSRLER